MKNFLFSIIALGLSAGVTRAVPFQELMEEDLQVFFHVRSLSETRAQWQDHVFADCLGDEKLQSLFKFFRTEESAETSGFGEVLENEFGLSYDELIELFPGQAALAVYNLAACMLGQSDRPDAAIMAEFSGDEERLNALMKIQFERNAKAQKEVNPAMEHEMRTERFLGETLYLDEVFDGEETYVEDGYALVDGIFVLASPESRLRSVVEAIKDGAESPLSESDVYLRSREASGRGDFRIYMNLSEIMPPLNQALMAQSMKGLAIFGVTPGSLESALSLESMQALFLDLDLTDEGLLIYSGLIYSEKRGLLSLLSYAEGKQLPEASYVPEGVLSSSVSLFDFGAMMSNLEKILTVASPSLPALIDTQIQTLQTKTGIDLRTSILENLGGELVSLSLFAEQDQEGSAVPQPHQLFVVGVKDAQALSQSLETLKDLAPRVKSFIEAQEYAGQTIFTIRGQADPTHPDASVNDLSYVITRSHLIVNVGPVGLLKEILSRMSARVDGLWQKPGIELLFEKIARPNAVTRSYVDVERMMELFFRSVYRSGAFDVEKGQHPGELPDVMKVPFRLISEMNEEADGFFVRTLIVQNEDGE